ncbi:MAG: alanine--tRNA ligase [Bacteroidota bacterium]
MVMKTSTQIRQEFLDFFREKQHEIVSSAPLVPQGDSTLLFTNAGMNQFKDVFLGEGSRAYNRAADTQKCLRVSGKHNDLEEVGVDTYHHTLFEMLGNWSFGDYFKREAIRWAWELLVDRWGLEADRLYATVHEGDAKLGLAPDEEAATFWRKETTINPDHILLGSSKDNFWMMGDTGPCGPCSELHVDLRTDAERAEVDGASLVNMDDPRVMEIWNLVFIQYNAQKDGSLQPLAAQHVDTGMGFERIVAVLQGKHSNYDTDLFTPILAAIAELSPRADIRSYTDIGGSAAEQERTQIAMRVIADHIRAIAFAIADGAAPSNVGRGYVIRRILRRAVRFGYQSLGLNEPFLFKLFATLKAKMGAFFPELVEQSDYIERVIRAEEESFLETLGTGIGFFEPIAAYTTAVQKGEAADVSGELLSLLRRAYPNDLADAEIKTRVQAAATEGQVPGEVTFLLHDTYGFPIDLTMLMAREEGIGVDMKQYQVLMAEQKARARAAANFAVDQSQTHAWTERTANDAATTFVGYDALRVDDARVAAYRTVEAEDQDPRYEIILDKTPFYAESGGQVGDTGTLAFAADVIEVLDTQKRDGRIVHGVERLPNDFSGPVTAQVDAERRARIVKHHTATHLLHAALREVLGSHVAQKGSLVAPDRLRFDFSHFERVSAEQQQQVEAIVNARIQQNIAKQEERAVPFDEAVQRGATALFGEKYGDTVRVITFDPDYSMELCGGTHADATGEIGLLRIVSEGSVAAGVRRIEAVVGMKALAYVEEAFETLAAVKRQFKSQQPVDREVEALVQRVKALEREVGQLKQEASMAQVDALINAAVIGDDVRIIQGEVASTDMKTLTALGQALLDKLGENAVAVLGTADPGGEKVYLVAVVTPDVVKRGVKAGQLVGAMAKELGGGGGGRPTLASAGGRKPERLAEVLAEVPERVRSSLS